MRGSASLRVSSSGAQRHNSLDRRPLVGVIGMNPDQYATWQVFQRMKAVREGREVRRGNPYYRLSTRLLLLMWRQYYLTGRPGVKWWWTPMRKVMVELDRRSVYDPVGLGARWKLWYADNIAVSPPDVDVSIPWHRLKFNYGRRRN